VAVDTIRIRRAGTCGDQLIAEVPAEIDIGNADGLREALLRALNSNARILIIDMSATTFCDVSGVHALERAYHRARASGTQLRLVVTAPSVRRMFTLNGLHRIIAMYPSLSVARPDPGGVRRAAVAGRRPRVWPKAWFANR
jgi:anti-sigma B factor antagonist